MSLLKFNKLNLLYKKLPEGAVAPSRWLQAQGYSRQLLYKYVKSGWLRSPGPDAYCRPTTELTSQGVVASWQHVLARAWHVGGETALNLLGHAHYLRLGGEAHVHLYGRGAVPGWVKGLSAGAEWVFHSRALFATEDVTMGLREWPSPIKAWPLTVSGAERAMLEALLNVRDAFSFTFAAELMQGLTTLRPKLVTDLLKACTHVKVKRLFLFMAAYYQLPWLAKVDVGQIDLGRGKRSVVQGGKLDSTYLITVPEGFHAHAG